MSSDQHREEIENIKGEMSSLHTKIDKVLTVLSGDDMGQSEGLVKELKQVRKDLDGLIDFKNRMVWIAATMIAIINIAWQYLTSKFTSNS